MTSSASPAAVAELVTQLWQTHLDLAEASPDDDFFLLGGNSLLAVRLAEQLEQSLQVVFPIEVLFVGGRLADVIAACQERVLADCETSRP